MSENKKLSIEIDGQKFDVDAGKSVIQVADEVGITIPRFCYHDKLSIAASCRMCLVDIEKMPKAVPACATQVSDGMIVRTRSDKARAAQKAIMEFLLINHPLDCPVCDQGGECELQDNSLSFGDQHSLYTEEKRHFEKIDIGPLVETYMNRCIQCTRCVRYGEEVAGLRELGGVSRGDRLEITTYVKHSMESEVSANIIDLCPVGALTAKPSKFQGRPWEYVKHDSISLHDGLGTNTAIHVRRGKIARVASRQNEDINQVWISDRDRFSYEAIFSGDRAQYPMIMNEAKQLEKAHWLDALKATKLTIEGAIQKYGTDQFGIFISPSATVEEHYLTKKLADQFGITNIDARFNQMDFRGDSVEPVYHSLGVEIPEVKNLDSIFLVGADPRMELPVLAIEIRNAVKRGANVALLNSYDMDQLHATQTIVEAPQNWVNTLASLLGGISEKTGKSIPAELKGLVDNAGAQNVDAVAETLNVEGKNWIVLGKDAISHPDYSVIKALCQSIAENSESAFGFFTQGANMAGAYLMGTAKSANTHDMLTEPLKAYVLIGAIDPEYDFLERKKALDALKQAELVVSITPFASEQIKKLSTIILPAAAWGETDGSLVNLEGKLQAVKAATQPLFEAKECWKILRVLGNEFECSGFDYVTANDVLVEAKNNLSVKQTNFMPYLDDLSVKWQPVLNKNYIAVPTESIYSTDAYVRRSPSLQKTPLALRNKVAVNDAISFEQWSKEGKTYDVRKTPKMANDCLRIPREFGLMINYYESVEG